MILLISFNGSHNVIDQIYDKIWHFRRNLKSIASFLCIYHEHRLKFHIIVDYYKKHSCFHGGPVDTSLIFDVLEFEVYSRSGDVDSLLGVSSSKYLIISVESSSSDSLSLCLFLLYPLDRFVLFLVVKNEMFCR